MSFLQEAFEKVCSEAKPAQGYYVSLMAREPFYGGPEEGGWWGCDTNIIAYQYFPTEEAADAAALAVKTLAVELSQQAQREHGQQCLREMDWLDARGLDADYLREPDGPEDYFVLVSEGLPQEHRDSRCYS